MTIWLILSAIIAPALFWVGYFYYKDRYQPEPLLKIGSTYLLGILSAFACAQFFRLLPLLGIPDDPILYMESDRIRYLIYSLVINGFFEELFKFLPFILIVIKFKAFDEKTDGIIYASVIALGFASYENMLYLSYMSGLALFGRAFASPLAHSIFSSIWGYSLGKAKILRTSRLKASLISIPLAALIHGLFNFLTTSSALRAVSAILILLLWLWRINIQDKSAA